MRWPIETTKCILCTKNPTGHWEHVIPKSIGGRLEAHIICNDCNHKRLGSKLVSKLKSDVTVRLAMENLKDELPSLYQKLQRGEIFSGVTSDGVVIRASNRDSGKRIIAKRSNDGRIIVDTAVAPKRLADILKKHGLPEEEILDWRRKFDALDEEELLIIPSGHTFSKRRTPPLHPELNAQIPDDRLPVLIAFEFLSLLIGDQILYSEFDKARDFILHSAASADIRVEHLQAGTYDAFHALLMEPGNGCTQVLIRLFRWIVFRVTFLNVDYQGKDCVYLEDLKTPRSLFAATYADARNGKWLAPIARS